MKTAKIVIGLAIMLCVAVLAAHPAKAQFFIPPGGCDKATGACRLNIPPGQPGPRAADDGSPLRYSSADLLSRPENEG